MKIMIGKYGYRVSGAVTVPEFEAVPMLCSLIEDVRAEDELELKTVVCLDDFMSKFALCYFTWDEDDIQEKFLPFLKDVFEALESAGIRFTHTFDMDILAKGQGDD